MFQRLAMRMAELGMMTEERAEVALQELAEWGDAEDEVREIELFEVFEVCGVAVSVHSEDVDCAEDAYRSILEEAAALSGGSITVSDVALDPAEGVGRDLRFRVNGEPRCWYVEQESDDYLDMGTVWTGIEDLEPGGDDPRVFHPAPLEGDDDFYLLATPEQATTLREEFGLEIEVRGSSGAEG